jgi:hypothetical protein
LAELFVVLSEHGVHDVERDRATSDLSANRDFGERQAQQDTSGD